MMCWSNRSEQTWRHHDHPNELEPTLHDGLLSNWSGYEVTTMRDMRTVFDALIVFASIIAIGTIVMTGLP